VGSDITPPPDWFREPVTISFARPAAQGDE
jgi:hypothetical protein